MIFLGLGQYLDVLLRATNANGVAEDCRARSRRALIAISLCSISLAGTAAFDEVWSRWAHGSFRVIAVCAGLYYCLQQHFIDAALSLVKIVRVLRRCCTFALLLEALALVVDLAWTLSHGLPGSSSHTQKLEAITVCTWATYILLAWPTFCHAGAMDIVWDATFTGPGGYGPDAGATTEPPPDAIGAQCDTATPKADPDAQDDGSVSSSAKAGGVVLEEVFFAPRWLPRALLAFFLVTPWTSFLICYPLSYEDGRFKVDYLLSSAIDVDAAHRVGNFAFVLWGSGHLLVAIWRHLVTVACLRHLPPDLEARTSARSKAALGTSVVACLGYFGGGTFETSYNRIFHTGSSSIMVLCKVVYAMQQMCISATLVPFVAPHGHRRWRCWLLTVGIGDVLGFCILARYLFLRIYMPLGFGELLLIAWETLFYATWFRAEELFCNIDLRLLRRTVSADACDAV
eukprot:TRINITY_DN17607_c0_g3_i3.p1 TRINITY_DN17607_c0_g3~~TRINITY_DN17607_c0_g3_i3.p1  ORF type:complete len:457 (-),score=18.78 TRINITY_DN17607_c0_g3_i3:4-1374(-)